MTYSFHKPAFDDIKWMKQKLKESQPQCCEFSVGNLLGWSKFYDGQVGDVENCLVSRLYKDDSFCFPKGKNCETAVKAIVNDFNSPKFSFLEKHET